VSPWVLVYFVSLVIFGSFFLVNLALAVLYLQFSKEFSLIPGSAVVSRCATQEQSPFTSTAADAAAATPAMTGQAGALDSYAGSLASSVMTGDSYGGGNSSNAGWTELTSASGGCDGAVVAEVTVAAPALAHESNPGSASTHKQDGQVQHPSSENVDAIGKARKTALTPWQIRQQQLQQSAADVLRQHVGRRQQGKQAGVQQQAGSSPHGKLQQMLREAVGAAAFCWAVIRHGCSSITEVRW